MVKSLCAFYNTRFSDNVHFINENRTIYHIIFFYAEKVIQQMFKSENIIAELS